MPEKAEAGHGGIPPGITPVYITEKTLERWGMKTGSDISDVLSHKFLPKQQLIDELSSLGFMCDFYELRDAVKNYPGDEILLVYDPESVYEQNFYWPSSLERFEEEKARIAIEQREAVEESNNNNEEKEEEIVEDTSPLEDRPITPRAWSSLGSEKETDGAKIKQNRPKLAFTISRPRREFGKQYELTDRDPSDKIPEFRRQKIPNYDTIRATLDGGFQAAVHSIEISTQTRWFRKVNKAIQSETINLTEDARKSILASTDMKMFLNSVIPRCERELEQNEAVDIFKNELSGFEDDDAPAGSQVDSSFRGLHTFQHLKFSKGRRITGIQWHPTRTGVVSFACTSNLSFDEWVDLSGQVMASHILIWNFKDVLQPESILEVPGMLYCFKVNPYNPNLIVGGLQTGQVILWDLADAESTVPGLEQVRKSGEEGNESARAIVKPKLLSHIDRSHCRAVTEIVWLPRGKQINKKGELTDDGNDQNPLFVSVSGDGVLLFWQTQPTVEDQQRLQQQAPAADKDTKWVPRFALPLSKNGEDGTLDAVKACLGDGTKLFAATESGEVVFGDWGAKSSEDPNKKVIHKVIKGHHLPCTAVERSPHFPDIFLSVGDWSFCIWKEGLETPLFKSPCAADYLTCARWSPTRPAVIITARADGSIDAWDLLDQCHKESLTYSVAQVPITSIEFWQNRATSQQFIGVGDGEGNLHALEVSRNFRRKLPKEEKLVQNFYERELQRLEYSKKRRAAAPVLQASTEGKASSENNDTNAEGAQNGSADTIKNAQPLHYDAKEEEAYRQMLKEFQDQLGEN